MTYENIYKWWSETRRSVTYYRLGGILLHDGGGWLLVRDKNSM